MLSSNKMIRVTLYDVTSGADRELPLVLQSATVTSPARAYFVANEGTTFEVGVEIATESSKHEDPFTISCTLETETGSTLGALFRPDILPNSHRFTGQVLECDGYQARESPFVLESVYAPSADGAGPSHARYNPNTSGRLELCISKVEPSTVQRPYTKTYKRTHEQMSRPGPIEEGKKDIGGSSLSIPLSSIEGAHVRQYPQVQSCSLVKIGSMVMYIDTPFNLLKRGVISPAQFGQLNRKLQR